MLKQEAAHTTLRGMEELDLIVSLCTLILPCVSKVDLVCFDSFFVCVSVSHYACRPTVRDQQRVRRGTQRRAGPVCSRTLVVKVGEIGATLRRD